MNRLDIGKTILQATTALLLIYTGFSIGRVVYTQAQATPTIERVLVSDKVKQCERVEGEYRLYYSDISEKYVSVCNVPETELFREEFDHE